MATALHVPHPRTTSAETGRTARQAADITRQRAGIRPVLPVVGERICRDFERGLSLRSLGKRWPGLGVATLEEILRVRLRELEAAVRRAGVVTAATACLLMGVSLADVCGLRPEAPMERSFHKCGRARKRGLEDSSCLIELRETAGVAA